MNIVQELNYLFDRKMKFKAFFVLVIIMLGSVVELLGVSIILPVISLATDVNAVNTNKVCIIISKVLNTKDNRVVLLVLIVIIIMIYVLKNIYLAWMTHRMNCFSKNTMRHFSTSLLTSYMKQPYAYFLNKNTAEILRSINSDTVNLYTTIANTMQVISQGITVILLIFYSILTNPVLTFLVAVLLGGSAAVIILFIQKKMRRMGQEYQQAASFIIKYAKQSFEGIKEVKITNRENYFINQYADVYERASEIERIHNLLSNLPKYLIETICIGGVMLYLAISILIGGELTTLIPQLGVFAVVAFKLLPCINSLYTNFSSMIYHKASIDVIYHDIKEVENVEANFADEFKEGKINKFDKEIQVNNISFSYEGNGQKVLDRINILIKKGTSIAFIGESGGGKSTLVDIILGLLTPQQGEIFVDGINIKEDLRGWHSRIGYIPQMIFLLDDSIRRNIAFGIDDTQIDDTRIWHALKEAKLDEFVEGLEKGLDTEVGESGTRLSGGQKQRIGIARALYNNPDILVFDEATSALDTETEREVMEAIENLHGSKTMIMIAHRISTIENCDHVYRVGEQTLVKVR